VSEQLRDKVFISYSHKDEEWMQKLKTMLHPLISKGKIIPWDDSNIKTGQKWHEEIISALETTKIAVMLVSDNFLASEYITNIELPILLEAAEKGECTICLIPISHCLFKEYGLDKYQAAHDINRPLDGLPPSKVKKALAEVAEEIDRIYNETAIKPPATVKKRKQIKILSVIASPEDVDDIYYEREQDAMLEAFKSFDREEVFLDMPDPVKSTLIEIKEHLENGKHDILHITAHGGIDEKGEGILSLEDQWGKLDEATGKKLLKYLVPAPRIVILSACHSARKEPDLMPVAQALFKEGIDIVIGMKTRISHAAAVEFNLAFFKALCQKITVQEAFQKGKDAIFKGEQKRIEEIPTWDAIKEYEIPQLLVRKKDENLTREDFSEYRIKSPDRPESHHFMGAKYLERGFIGRRQVLRDIYKSIDNKEGAIVLKGPGGIGKSTLTTRAAANLRIKGFDFIVVRGETTIEQILEAISKKAAAKGVEKANEVYEENIDVEEKLAWYLDNFLLKQKMVIIFDNFEENQDEKKGDFNKERLKEFLWFFRDALKNKETFLFFSTRYKLAGFDSRGITKEIPEFSSVEFRKMLGKSNALRRLDSKSLGNLQQEIGGNPRALELLDQIAYKEFKKRDFTWVRLKDLIPELQERIIHKKGAEDDFTPLLLEKLFSYLTGPQRQVLDILSIYRNPVPIEAIAAHNVKMERLDRIRLVDLSLLECIDSDEINLYYVHRLTAQYLLKQMKQAVITKYHLQAAQYFTTIRTEEGKVYLEYLIESRWHYIRADEWDKAAFITFGLYDYLTLHGYPQWSMELLQELDIEKINETAQSVACIRIGTLNKDFGKYDNALSLYKKAYEISKKNNDDNNIAASLHQIGMIYQLKGDYDAALKQYEKSLEIKEKIGDIKSASSSLHQIGMIYQYKGDYDAALKQYEKAGEIFEKSGDVRGLSYSLHQVGIIYQLKGDYDFALKQYEKAKEIFEKIGDIKGVSFSLHQIGIIYQHKGDYDAALKQYGKAIEISEEIGDIKGVSEILQQTGTLYQEKGDYDAALKQCGRALEISEKIGDVKGMSSSLHSIGIIYQNKGNYDAALKKHGKSLEIREKINDIRGVSESLYQIGMVYEKKGEYDAALKLYEMARNTFEKIGAIKEFSSSLHQIGNVYYYKGDYESALKLCERSLEIWEQIGYIPGVAISMGQMGNLYFQKKEFETALKYYIQAFLVFKKIGSPYTNQARKDIARTRKKLSGEQFNAILKKFNLKPESLDSPEDPKKELFDFLVGVTSQALSAKEKSSQEKEKIAAQVNEMINKIPDDKPEIEGIKSYIQMLLAFVNRDDVQTYMEKIPKELKEMFEKMRKKF
jgi:tetratricopeptide (TPR) repeat protein